MHVVIVGCGRVGSGLARIIEAQGHSVAVLDKERKLVGLVRQERLVGFLGDTGSTREEAAHA